MVEVYKEVSDLSCNPKVTHDNYLQDCIIFERHGILYDKYICNMIDKISHVDHTDRANDSVSLLFHDGNASIMIITCKIALSLSVMVYFMTNIYVI